MNQTAYSWTELAPADLDQTELFTLRSNVDEMQGRLALLMKR